MKKVLLATIYMLTLMLHSMAQKETAAKGWETQIPKDCFCCNDKIYNLPTTPPISGPDQVACDSSASFSTYNCPGAQVQWTVSPATAISGQNTSTVTLSPTYTATSYTLTVTIKCGNKTVTNQKTVKIKIIQNCTAKFSIVLTELPNGLFRIDATPQTTAGVTHYWGVLGNSAFPECTHIPLIQIQNSGTFGATVSSSGIFTPIGMGTGINPGTANTPYGYQYSGLGNSGCYKITHWVKCCDGWHKYTQCFCITQNASKQAPEKPGQEVPIPNSNGKMKLIKPYELKITETIEERASDNEIPKNLKSSS